MKKTLFLLFFIIVGTLEGQQTIVPIFEVALDKPYYQAGDKVVLTVTLKNFNTDRWYMENVVVSLESNAIISYESLSQGPFEIDINGQKSFTFRFRLKNLPNGDYEVKVKYSSRYICATSPVRPQDDETTVVLKVDNSEPSLSLFHTEFSVAEGEEFALVFLNQGVIAKNAHFQISSDARFSYKGELGYITTTASSPVTIREKRGTYKAYVNLTYANKLGQERSVSIPITVTVLPKNQPASKEPPRIVASLMEDERKATPADYLPYYAFGLFLILLFSFLLFIIARMP